MLAMGRALMSEPKLLMLDEPSSDWHPPWWRRCTQRLVLLRQQGMTLLLADQSVELALEVADYGYVLQTGRTMLEGPARDLASDPDVQRVYLGLETVARAG